MEEELKKEKKRKKKKGDGNRDNEEGERPLIRGRKKMEVSNSRGEKARWGK